MNTQKIAALYASPIFNTLLRFPAFDPTTTLTEQVMKHVLRKAREMSQSEDGRHYEAAASNPSRRRERYKDDAGGHAMGFLNEHITKRAADWMLNQIPEPVTRKHEGLADHDVFLVNVMGYGRHVENPELDVETRAGYYFGSESDLQPLMRGLASIRRKRRKQAKKLEAQLRAYHAQQVAAAAAQELAQLRRGVWLGAEKAIATAARVDEPGIQFLGDTSLTYEQRKAMGLCYYAVHEDTHGMPSAFPMGTGMALKPVKRSQELVDGAVYFWRWLIDGKVVTQFLGRLDMSAKERGRLPLRFEDGTMPAYCWAHYGESAAAKGIEIYRVTHYSTRNSAPVMQAETQPVPQQPVKRQRKQRELAHAA
jgi:hypothetical protein